MERSSHDPISAEPVGEALEAEMPLKAEPGLDEAFPVHKHSEYEESLID